MRAILRRKASINVRISFRLKKAWYFFRKVILVRTIQIEKFCYDGVSSVKCLQDSLMRVLLIDLDQILEVYYKRMLLVDIGLNDKMDRYENWKWRFKCLKLKLKKKMNLT